MTHTRIPPALLALALFLLCALARPADAQQPLGGRCTQGDCVNGQGTFVDSEGTTTYTGTFTNGQLNGQGTRFKSDGRKYFGEFKGGRMHGQGVYAWPNGDRYEGELKNDVSDGQGTTTFHNGQKHTGEYRNDKREGQGVYTWPDGHRYIGEFKDNKMGGLGIRNAPNGVVERGQWRNDEFVLPMTPQAFAQAQADQELAAQAQASGLAEEKARLAAERQRLEEDRARLASQKAAPASAKAGAQAKAPALQARRVALVIGNGAYKDAPLKNPVNDAHDMAAALRSLGFEVILRENASLAQMEGAVEEFWGKLKKGGAGLFYFAGHGLQVAGKNYLVPVDARLSAEQDARYRCMDAGLVLGRMENAGNDLNLVILDACRNNPFARSWRSAEQGLAKMDAPRGSIIAYATAPDSVAADGQGRNGVYTEKLLRAIRMPGQPVELVFKRVRDEVMRATGDKQVPWESTSLRGDFYFTNP